MSDLTNFTRYQETVEEFLDRTYWNAPSKKVLVFVNKQQREHPDFAPTHIMTWAEGKARLEDLKEYSKKERKNEDR